MAKSKTSCGSEKSGDRGSNDAREAAEALASSFDVDHADLPDHVDDNALTSGGYPYASRMKRKDYEKQLIALQIELTKLQRHVRETGERIVVVFEGRDTAGKGGCIARFMQYLNPRHAHAVALAKPTDTERGQWYFQRYAAHMPTAGDIVLFDRSWYNRAGVERVMGFCNQDELASFLREAPQFEGMLARDGIRLFKMFLTIGQEMQLKRFHDRRHNPLKQWKLTEMDRAAIDRWHDYTEAKEEMFRFTHTETSPWTVIRANDKRRARLEVIRHVLLAQDYGNKDLKAAGTPDPLIIGSGPDFFFGEAKKR